MVYYCYTNITVEGSRSSKGKHESSVSSVSLIHSSSPLSGNNLCTFVSLPRCSMLRSKSVTELLGRAPIAPTMAQVDGQLVLLTKNRCVIKLDVGEYHGQHNLRPKRSFGHTAIKRRVWNPVRRKFNGMPSPKALRFSPSSAPRFDDPNPKAPWRLMTSMPFFL